MSRGKNDDWPKNSITYFDINFVLLFLQTLIEFHELPGDTEAVEVRLLGKGQHSVHASRKPSVHYEVTSPESGPHIVIHVVMVCAFVLFLLAKSIYSLCFISMRIWTLQLACGVGGNIMMLSTSDLFVPLLKTESSAGNYRQAIYFFTDGKCQGCVSYILSQLLFSDED